MACSTSMMQTCRPRAVAFKNALRHRSVPPHAHRTRAAPNDTSASTSEKATSTISSLDALLGVPAQEERLPATPTPPATASTSYSASTPVAEPARQTQQTWGKPAAKKNYNLEDIMAFDGLAPEIINGRAAMLGFMAAIAGELSTGQSLFSQLVAGGGMKALFVIGLVVAASFAPTFLQVPFDKMFGKDKEPAFFGPFNPNAEVRNGRAAMLGLMALLFLEGASSQAFFM